MGCYNHIYMYNNGHTRCAYTSTWVERFILLWHLRGCSVVAAQRITRVNHQLSRTSYSVQNEHQCACASTPISPHYYTTLHPSPISPILLYRINISWEVDVLVWGSASHLQVEQFAVDGLLNLIPVTPILAHHLW